MFFLKKTAKMEKPLIVVTRRIPGSGLNMISPERFEVRLNSKDKSLEPSDLKKFVKGAAAILALLTDKIDDAVLAAAGRSLKIVANYAVGFDNVDLAACRKRKIIVTNTPEVSTEAVAEHTFGLILAVLRQIVQADKFTRQGKYHGWQPELFLGGELFGKTLGVLGLGRIGRRVAEIAALGFKMKVVYYDNGNRDRGFDQKIGGEAVSIRKVLTASDVLTLHVPLTAKTRHLMSRSELASMKKTAILVNTSRGPVVDEKALAASLASHEIAGAGIDVYEFEPEILPELKALENVVLTPHIASATNEAREAMSALAVRNILEVLRGAAPLTPAK